jgi:hypothetical protein
MKSAKKLRLGAKRTGAYVYGTLRRIVGNPASPRSLAKLMALEKDGTTRYSSAYLMSAKNAFDRGQGAEFQRLILTRMRKERGRDVDMRRLAGNPSFERTLRSSASMTPAVFSATMRGNLSSELMVRSWNQKKLVRGVIFKYKIDPNHYYFIFEEPGIYRSEPYTIAEATTGLTLGGTGSFKQIIEDGEEKIRKFIASKGKRKYDSLIASAEKLNHIGR